MIFRSKRVLELLQSLNQKVDKLMAAIDDLQAAVAAETTVDQSVITLLNSLSAQLSAALASNDTAAIEAVVQTMNANATALAAAVTANTPAAPPASGASAAAAKT